MRNDTLHIHSHMVTCTHMYKYLWYTSSRSSKKQREIERERIKGREEEVGRVWLPPATRPTQKGGRYIHATVNCEIFTTHATQHVGKGNIENRIYRHAMREKVQKVS